MTRLRRLTPALVVAASVSVLIAATAGAAAAPEPGTTAKTTVNKKLKKLKKRIGQLQRQLEDVSRQVGPRGPEGPQGADGPPGPATGPAGGALTGTYPNPLIATNAVDSPQIADNAVDSSDIANGVVGILDIGENAVGPVELGANAVGSDELLAGSVGGDELKRPIAVVGTGVAVTAASPRSVEVACPNSHPKLLAGGHAWQDDEANSIIFSAPDSGSPHNRWVVRGMVPAGSNTLYAWATCLER